MRFRGTAVKTTMLVAAMFASLVLVAPATSAKSSNPPVFWVDLSGTAQQHPDFVFFTANSGGQVHSIKWNGWGSNRAVGRGIYHDTSPTFPGKVNREGAAKIIAWKPVSCVPDFGNRKGRTIHVYSKAKLYQRNGKGKHRWVNIDAYTGILTCR